MYDHLTEASLLYDFYGELLSERQKEVLTLRYEDDLSLAEIAEELGISRQGVHDALKNGEKALQRYEEKLGLVKRLEDSTEVIKKIDAEIGDLLIEMGEREPAAERLLKIRKIIDNLEL
ncbi:MAG: HTH domain-containing protein [Firmicutes bacterium]|nr:HTH domain-containing protein [Bacillota bacterium]MBR6014654.1 HTH domain-containing protein [Bacillota bacterium]